MVSWGQIWPMMSVENVTEMVHAEQKLKLYQYDLMTLDKVRSSTKIYNLHIIPYKTAR